MIFKKIFIFSVFVLYFLNFVVLRIISEQDKFHYRLKVKSMFYHAYNGYLENAYPYDELRPITCDGQNTWGSYSLTLIDALDTLVILGNFSEFKRVVNVLQNSLNFDRDINISVFETNIRVVGGLLSGHLMSRRAGLHLEPGWPCDGPLLRLAEKVAKKLLPAFKTNTGMPYGTVNLLYGVPSGETTVTCTAAIGTYIVEFGTLSKLTGNTIYIDTAMKALQSLWRFRSSIGLVGNHIDVMTGKWVALESSIGAGIDSYFEYLVKGSILFDFPEFIYMFNNYRSSIEKYLKKEDWYVWANMDKGSVTQPMFQSLEAFWPGLLSMVGDYSNAIKTFHNYHKVWKQYGFSPEFYNIPKSEAHTGREAYPLRPEFIESAMYLYRANTDPYILQVAVNVLESIETLTKTSCGYATVKNVKDHSLENRMESFFLAETVKYLYLIFDNENFIHNTGNHAYVVMTTRGKCIVESGQYIFNTEAHPIDGAALQCCSNNHQPATSISDILKDSNLLGRLFEVDTQKFKKKHKIQDKHCSVKINEDFTNSTSNRMQCHYINTLVYMYTKVCLNNAGDDYRFRINLEVNLSKINCEKQAWHLDCIKKGLSKTDSYTLQICDPEKFETRLMVMGEMFVDNFKNLV